MIKRYVGCAVLLTALILGVVSASTPRSMALAENVTGTQRVMVLRVYFDDYAANSRYTEAEVNGFFVSLNTLWQDTSYGQIDIDAQVSTLYQLPDDRSKYIDDFADGDLSNGGKFMKVMKDAVAAAPAGLNWNNLEAVMVVMAETDPSQMHRGQATGACTVPMGPGGDNKQVGCAIFSENPSHTDGQVWGRWAHEIGHAFQEGGPAHPSNYNSHFELMDANMPGQVGVFSKQEHTGFPGWLPPSKYITVTPGSGGASHCLWAMEYDPADKPNPQAIKIELTGDLYYLVSVRRAVLGDDLHASFSPPGIPDEGVLIERVEEGAAQWVTLQGNPTRNDLWHAGDTFAAPTDGIVIEILQKYTADNYCFRILYDGTALQPDVMVERWTQPPGDTWETTDIWIDSPLNGYGTYRYGMWNDLSGNLVPTGNGDDPGVGQSNRVYARVRNVGTATATDVEVTWEITDPLGVGIAGANGWATIGTVDKTDFPSLANILAGTFVDVYVEWIPDFPVSAEDLEAGIFSFHSCLRVKLNQVAGETVFGNQDGVGEQENISHFQAIPPDEAPEGGKSVHNGVIKLRNDDPKNKKFFYLSYDSDLPEGWDLDVNGGNLAIELNPGAIRKIPVTIVPGGDLKVGSVFGVDIHASSIRVLTSDIDPKDTHIEYVVLGGVRIESRVLHRPEIRCEAILESGEITVKGQIEVKNFRKFYDRRQPPVVAIQGIDGDKNLMRGTLNVSTIDLNGAFSGTLRTDRSGGKPAAVVCLFAGTTYFASAGTRYVEIIIVDDRTSAKRQVKPTDVPKVSRRSAERQAEPTDVPNRRSAERQAEPTDVPEVSRRSAERQAEPTPATGSNRFGCNRANAATGGADVKGELVLLAVFVGIIAVVKRRR